MQLRREKEMFDASEGKKIALKIYSELIKSNDDVSTWEHRVLDIMCEELLVEDTTELSNLIAWAMEDISYDEMVNLFMSNEGITRLLVAALEAEHYYGWGCE